MKALDAAWRAAYRVAHRAQLAWWAIAHPPQRGAHVAVWRGETLLLVRTSYRCGVGVPGGHVGRAETPRRAAQRELTEEVGIEIRESDLHFIEDFRIDFENKLDTASFFELRLPPDSDVAVRIDHREIVFAEFCPEGQLLERDLLPHLVAYLDHRNR